jgi:hypothetical protein
MKRWAILLLLVAVAGVFTVSWNLLGERSADDRNEPRKPPFTARFGDLVLDIPEGPGIYRASFFESDRKQVYGSRMTVDLCDGEKSAPLGLCREIPGKLIHSISLFISEPRPGKVFKLLKERPADVAAPAPTAMLLVPQEGLPQDIAVDSEAYELSRIRSLGISQILTTERGWPIAACVSEDHGRGCAVGFVVSGAFVELRFFGEPGRAYDQAQVWAVTSAVDERIRSLIAAP